MSILKEIKRQVTNLYSMMDESKIILEKDTRDEQVDILVDYFKLKKDIKKFEDCISAEREEEKRYEKTEDEDEVLRHLSLESKGVQKEFGTLKEIVKDVMRRHPSTRNSDNVLYFTILQEMGADTLEEAKYLNVNLISIHKTRQIIQNKEGLFPPTEDIKQIRAKRNSEIRDYMRGQ